MAEMAETIAEAVPPLGQQQGDGLQLQPEPEPEPEPELPVGAVGELLAHDGGQFGLLTGMAQPVGTCPVVVDGSVSKQQATVTWKVSLPSEPSAPPRFELQYGAPKLGRWRTLEKKDMVTEEVNDGKIPTFPSATGMVPAKQFQATVWVPGDGDYVLRMRARYGDGNWSTWSTKSDTVARTSTQPLSTEAQAGSKHPLSAPGPASPIAASAGDDESYRELGASRVSLTQEESVRGYLNVAVTGYESHGTGKEQHIVWLLCVTRGDGDGGSIREILGRRYSGIHQFNEHLLKTKCTPAAVRSAGGKWTKKVQRSW